MKTGTKKTGKPVDKDNKAPPRKAQLLEQSVASAPSLFILPKDLSPEARIILLSNPAGPTKTSRFLICPQKGFFEFVNVAEQKSCRSWLLTPQDRGTSTEDGAEGVERAGYVLRRPDLLIATPLDPLFIILPMMASSNGGQESYLSCTDYIFNLELEGYEQLHQLLRQPVFGPLLKNIESRIDTISASITLGDNDEAMYRLSIEKVVRILISKAMHLADNGLPSSMEQHFVQQALETPVTHMQLDELEEIAQLPTAAGEMQVSDASQDSLCSADSAGSVSTAPTSISTPSRTTEGAPAQVVNLLRIRTAWEYVLRSYVSPTLQVNLTAALQQQTLVDFKPLLQYENSIAALKQKAQALRTLSDNISRKRSLDDDEASAKADEKRRKKEEEEQRKKNMSHGVKKLMKANTSGMMKLSSFFTKPPAK